LYRKNTDIAGQTHLTKLRLDQQAKKTTEILPK
jgi:hypothetical protein